jgi:YfiH family protein
VITWHQPGYLVAFTTRVGGVSEGVYESLNLTARTGDDGERVEENRRRVCAEVGLPYNKLSFNHQVHATAVHRAGGRGAPGDGLWSDDPGQPMLTFTADCLPIAIARTDGERRLALVHAGWRGLSSGVVAAGVAAVGGETAAVVGPAIGPCCYEVGDEVSARFDPDLTVDRHLDLWTAAERALRRAGVGSVERLDLCTCCNPELFFSHRRSGEERGVQGLVGAVA